MTNEQIEQKKKLLAEKMNEMKVIYDELAEAGAIELSEDKLAQAAGGIVKGWRPPSVNNKNNETDDEDIFVIDF